MNSVNILGTLVRDVELKYSQSGTAIGNFSIAVKDGYNKDKTHFFDVVAFGKQAETINTYFNKGSRILINGELNQETWEKDGQKKSKVTIKLNGFTFVDKKSESNNQPQQQYNRNDHVEEVPTIEINEDEIPF